MGRGDTVEVRRSARHRVRHFGADLEGLNDLLEDAYPRLMLEGDGVHLTDIDGHRVIDAGNHLGACVLGHGRDDMAQAIAAQVRTLEFSSLEAGTSHPYVLRLAEALASVMPVRDPIFSFTSSGSEANEVAIKIARDYFRRKGQTGRTKILSRYGSYHGSTYAATTATAIPAFREPFRPLVPDFVALPQPFPDYCGGCGSGERCPGTCMDLTRDTVEREGPNTVAAILAEPVSIPGAVKVPPPDYWPRLRQLCDEYGILLIADEVVTGFGRTGKMFGCDHWSVSPDILTFAKGLTSGYVPMGGAAVGRHVEEPFEGEPLVHVSTFSGHAVACAAAMKTLEIIDADGLVERAAEHADAVRDGLARLAAEAPVGARSSTIGLLGSVELAVPDGVDAERFRAIIWHYCYESGILVRVTKAERTVSIFFYPPLSISGDLLGEALERAALGVSKALAGELQ